jgi:hypothetical protein
VRSLEQVAGVQKRDPPLAYTARSGVESQQKTIHESVLSWSWCGAVKQPIRESSEQDADVQAPTHFLHERPRHPLQAIWAVMAEGGGAFGECRCRAAQRVTGHSSSLEAGAEVLHDAKQGGAGQAQSQAVRVLVSYL